LLNLAITLVLFVILELAYRVYKDGPAATFEDIVNIMNEVPYSNLGTRNWVISDPILGYRLNPQSQGVNSLSVRHDQEITIPKAAAVYRIVFLGDSIAADRPGFVSYTRDAYQDR
jgi:hypothetical protein